ncbi:MAG TPA: response regulator [bacterium]|nr:response regulator [bacterium]
MSDGRKLVYIVDDEADIRDLLARALESSGFAVATISSGIEMMKRLREQTPDLILLDIMMSWVSGLELCQTLKKEELFRCIPVVIITAHHRSEIEEKIKACGADDCLYKPFKIADLLAMARKYTATAESSPAGN